MILLKLIRISTYLIMDDAIGDIPTITLNRRLGLHHTDYWPIHVFMQTYDKLKVKYQSLTPNDG